jgi:hypothetical protein
VSSVLDHSPAKQAGIQPQDVILTIDSVFIRTPSDVLREMGKHRAGDKVKVRIRRGDDELESHATVEALPERRSSAERKPGPAATSAAEVEQVQPPVVLVLPDRHLMEGGKVPLDRGAAEKLAEHYRVLLQQLERMPPPPSSGTVVVQRSDLDKQLSELTRALDALQKQVAQLSAEVKQLAQRLEDNP